MNSRFQEELSRFEAEIGGAKFSGYNSIYISYGSKALISSENYRTKMFCSIPALPAIFYPVLRQKLARQYQPVKE